MFDDVSLSLGSSPARGDSYDVTRPQRVIGVVYEEALWSVEMLGKRIV